MCDDRTLQEDAAFLSRRDVAVGGLAGLALLSGCAAGSAGVASGDAREVAQSVVRFRTADGTMDAQFAHPASGRHPLVLFWPDIAGPRPATATMAARLAGAGYAVLVLNQYYRSAPAPHFQTNPEWRTEAGRARVAAMRERLSASGLRGDTEAALHWAADHPAIDPGRGIAAIGYCMGGAHAVLSGATDPRVRAVASFHGAAMVSEGAASPHRLIGELQAELLLAIAQNDDAAAPEDKDVLRAAAQSAGLIAEIEVYPAQHGWCTIDSPVYDAVQAERAWARMLALFERRL